MRVCLPFNALLVTNTYPICTDLISRFNHITLFEMAWEAEFKHSLLILKLHKTLKDTAHKSEENAYMVTNIKTVTNTVVILTPLIQYFVYDVCLFIMVKSFKC
jgi:hypothetical protein